MALPNPTLPEDAQRALSSYLSRVHQEGNPATWFGLTNAHEELYFEGLGERVYGMEEKVNEDTVLQLWSSSKLVTTVAALQQVDAGLISLDDAEGLDKILPELASLQVLKGYSDDGVALLERASAKITLRMLLNHSSGIAYDITNKNIGRYQKENNIPSIYSPRPPLESFMLPLAFEPGTSWAYGMGVDWAGIMVARLSGLDLEEYFKAHIWKCCDITTISFIPPKDWDAIGMQTTTRDPPNNGRIQISKENTLGRDVHQDFGPIYTGGGGLFGTARDYLRFLRGVLRSADPELKEEERLLSPGMFKLMFTDTLPDLPQVKKSLRDFVVGGQIYDRPQELHENEVGYAPGSFIVKRDTDLGRKAMSGTWEGMSKTYHWLDPATGIAGICFTNLFSPVPDPYRKVFNQFEAMVYDSLKA